MKHYFAQVAFGLGANALIARQSSQCIQLQASGGVSGILGQLSDGQNRVGGGYPTGCYCLSNGGFTDSNGRGCILTPPTTQFQCDVGASPTTGFAIDSSGQVTYNSSSKFYACPAADGEYNVYTVPVAGQDKCVEISLSSAGSCGSGPSQPSAPAPAPSSPAQTGNQCPADLSGAYQLPHLIIPIDSQQPSKAFGTSYNGKVDSHTCSIFNFDIPMSYLGKTCSVVFLFPEQKDLETSSFTVSGSGTVDFTKLKSPASQQTTYANQPGKESDLASISITPGITSSDCAAGQTVSYEVCSHGDFALDYFQDYNPSPIGLYIRQC